VRRTTISFVFDLNYGVYRTRKEAMDAALYEPGFGNSGIFDVTEHELQLPAVDISSRAKPEVEPNEED